MHLTLARPCTCRPPPHLPPLPPSIHAPGTGKTVYVQAGLELLDKASYQNIQTAFSAQTNANQVQDIIDNKLDKRRKVRGGGRRREGMAVVR